ncbi:3-deoxy-7-phosphoheptulonate synthase [Chromobacterium sp. LK1]|uniref:3-deoxy-7-phosphoheptulonate synthase n=1 Tax=Chromobacterium sp. LK1 TaxID=1628193 RepID=UPI0006532139|nr:3-deoxy-7-phosphoheptulonate synthase [Chromobacterium sp. LK1]KMN30789.1 3-deoxy-7-phosphoheptulonate synthase [Chromobacterium sp. LK1]
MIIIMNRLAPESEVTAVVDKIRAAGLSEHVSRGAERTIIGAVGDERSLSPEMFESMPGVERAMRVVREYRIVSRETHPQDSVVQVRGLAFGGPAWQVIAGPSAVESGAQVAAAARAAREAGCRLLHGGVFKQHPSPYGFQGLGVEGIEQLIAAGRAEGLPVVSELADVRMLDVFLEQGVDVIQIGSRSMQNVELLKEVGRLNKPVILKRGVAATLGDWLMAAEYIAAGGNHNIVFCERGIRSFEPAYRATLDVSAIPLLKRETHLPVIVDPSHAAGKAWLVPALAKAALAAGADGLLLDMHPQPEAALCEADQALTPAGLAALMAELRPLAQALGRSL